MPCEAEGCLFCKSQRFSKNREVGLPAEDSIVFRDSNVLITPDIAPIVVGHFLIVTESHAYSYGNADDVTFASLQTAKEFLLSRVFKGQRVAFFEHGGVMEDSGVACIDHAHIHAIPVANDFDVRDQVELYAASGKIQAVREEFVRCTHDNQSYMYYELSDGFPWLYRVNALPHQFFRKIVCGVMAEINYQWGKQYVTSESKKRFLQTLQMAPVREGTH